MHFSNKAIQSALHKNINSVQEGWSMAGNRERKVLDIYVVVYGDEWCSTSIWHRRKLLAIFKWICWRNRILKWSWSGTKEKLFVTPETIMKTDFCLWLTGTQNIHTFQCLSHEEHSADVSRSGMCFSGMCWSRLSLTTCQHYVLISSSCHYIGFWRKASTVGWSFLFVFELCFSESPSI